MTDNNGAVVTKLRFSPLFSKAWYQAIKPETIVNGFRATGICPLNRDAITISDLPTDQSSSDDDDSAQNKLPLSIPEPPLPTFTDEQVSLFQRRYENGYTICALINTMLPGSILITLDSSPVLPVVRLVMNPTRICMI